MTDSRAKYRALCEGEPTIPFFSQAWWLDATAGSANWDVALVETNGKVNASLPYTIRKRFGLTLLGQPALTQALGPWIRPSRKKQALLLAEQKDLMTGLIKELPRFAHYSQNWHWSVTNWLPFHWAGFSQTTRYTYLLDNLIDEDALWSGLRENIRTDIRKASNRFGLNVRADLSINDFILLSDKTFARQGLAAPYRTHFLTNLDAACAQRGVRQILIAVDDQGRHHAGAYIVWNSESAYYLMGGADPELRNSGAASLCIWEAIKFAAAVSKRFDFEGSMIESVERIFRSFGAKQVPYFCISRTPARLLRAGLLLRDVLKGQGA
jgi:hypothetical protein